MNTSKFPTKEEAHSFFLGLDDKGYLGYMLWSPGNIWVVRFWR